MKLIICYYGTHVYIVAAPDTVWLEIGIFGEPSFVLRAHCKQITIHGNNCRALMTMPVGHNPTCTEVLIVPSSLARRY